MKKRRIIGKEVVTSEPNEEILGDNDNSSVESVYNLTVCNMGSDVANLVINEGSPVALYSGESLTLPEDIIVSSIVVIEPSSAIRYMGIEI